MIEIITQIAIVFILIAIGYAANKLKVLDEGFNRKLSRLVILIACPCLVLYSVMVESVQRQMRTPLGSPSMNCVVMVFSRAILRPLSESIPAVSYRQRRAGSDIRHRQTCEPAACGPPRCSRGSHTTHYPGHNL